VLTLTATPIPRTLAMSLEGIRDFSVIATAPQRRLAIKTSSRRRRRGIVREAALREMKRGGQVYYLHNDGRHDPHRCRATRRAGAGGSRRDRARPDPERELEHVMRDFYAQRVNLLVCSTIIETGIDVPTANTIISCGAPDRFGLPSCTSCAAAFGALAPPGVRTADAARRRADRAAKKRPRGGSS